MSASATPVGSAASAKKVVPAAEEPKDTTHTPSQRYLSTRGGSYGVYHSLKTCQGLKMLTASSFRSKRSY